MKRKVCLESYLYRNVNYGNGSLKVLVVCECAFKQYLRHYGKLYFVLGLVHLSPLYMVSGRPCRNDCFGVWESTEIRDILQSRTCNDRPIVTWFFLPFQILLFCFINLNPQFKTKVLLVTATHRIYWWWFKCSISKGSAFVPGVSAERAAFFTSGFLIFWRCLKQ